MKVSKRIIGLKNKNMKMIKKKAFMNKFYSDILFFNTNGEFIDIKYYNLIKNVKDDFTNQIDMCQN